jgi:hypothetical protein
LQQPDESVIDFLSKAMATIAIIGATGNLSSRLVRAFLTAPDLVDGQGYARLVLFTRRDDAVRKRWMGTRTGRVCVVGWRDCVEAIGQGLEQGEVEGFGGVRDGDERRGNGGLEEGDGGRRGDERKGEKGKPRAGEEVTARAIARVLEREGVDVVVNA